MNKEQAIEFAKKIIAKYEEKGMAADVLAWQTILDVLSE